MKKQYTKRQIQEAIAYWQKQIDRLDESADYTWSQSGVLYKLSTLFRGPYMFNGDIDNGEQHYNTQVTFDKFPSYNEIFNRFNRECLKKFGQGLYTGPDGYGVTIHLGGVRTNRDCLARIYVTDDKQDALDAMKYAGNNDMVFCLFWPDPNEAVAEVLFAGRQLDVVSA